MLNTRLRHIFSLLILVIATASAFGAVGGSISGTIKDSSGSVIPGVALTVTNTALGTTFKTTTDARGYYSFPSLPVGRYDLVIDAPGFQSQKKTALGIDSDGALEVNVTLEVAGVNSSVSVSTTEEL